MNKRQIAIIGATGFTGSELVRILNDHPQVHIAAITSESRAGERFSDVHPFFQGICDKELIAVDDLPSRDIDLAFLALPHGVSMDYVKRFQDQSFNIIDLSGDFRLEEQATYEDWYNKEHTFAEGFQQAAYGIPELFLDKINQSSLIANPGCFPTCAILGLAPLMKEQVIDPSFTIVDAKTGVTGAGIKSKPVNHFSNVNDNFKPYGLKTHRHAIEIEEKLSILGDANMAIQFTPHLLPVDRGILATIYAKPNASITEQELLRKYKNLYDDMPFIRMRSQEPAVKDVRGTNYCDIYVTYDDRTGNIMVISAIDNLVKGAAGQAVQNMNVLFGWEETLGLHQAPLSP